jgi:hypothetical protein
MTSQFELPRGFTPNDWDPRVSWSTIDWASGETARIQETRDLANLANLAPRIGWDDFIRNEFRWYAGEHVAAIGPTGQGKTFFISKLLPSRKFVVVFGTKPSDSALTKLIKVNGYKHLQAWPSNWFPVNKDEPIRRVLWPNVRSLKDNDARVLQKGVFEDALWKIFREGGWTTFLDETSYVVQELGLGNWVKRYLLQARELKVSLICATQRPAWVPREIYDQSTHVFLWRDNDETNLKTLAGFSMHSGSLIRKIVGNLEQFQVLYLNTRTGRMLRTRAPFS